MVLEPLLKRYDALNQLKRSGKDNAVVKKKAKLEFALSRNPPLGPDTNAKSLHPTKAMNEKKGMIKPAGH